MYVHNKYFKIILLTPALLIIAVLTIYPIFNLVQLSFQEYNYLTGVQRFVGIKNFLSMFTDRHFMVGLGNTLEFVVLATLSELSLGLALALLFNSEFAGKKYLTVIMVVPMLLSTMVICASWRVLFHYEYGLINYILRSGGLEGGGWLIDRNIAMKSVVIVDIWQWTPLAFLILLAGLQSIPRELHEAAKVDGATGWQTLRRITLPLLRAPLFMVILLRTIDTFRIFDKVYALTGGGPGTATETISYYIYRNGFKYFHLGQASTASIIMLVIVSGISIIYMRKIIAAQS